MLTARLHNVDLAIGYRHSRQMKVVAILESHLADPATKNLSRSVPPGTPPGRDRCVDDSGRYLSSQGS